MTPYLEHRQAGVVIQTDWTTCGPAAVATLLSSFFGMPAAEAEVVLLARPHMPADRDPDVTGYTLGSLRAAAQALGFTSEGYRMELAALVEYQSQTGLPVLVHLEFPQRHFAVLVGSREGRFVVADPSWGVMVEPEEAFVASWSGHVLVTLPPVEGVASVRQRTAEILWTYLEDRPRQLLLATTVRL
ncbi:C39 family peptidase [Limnochorda pilosa]|uniref:Peptidase C39 n=1 Tax=Limnochorda pilosa TaxID=1555112 RepID=A0A0K2SHS2_LIMPI|nr:cysteine peptidase family C39 domain-containing protein [Limnochorda pilosa]BAS26394.1 peptidase C39 [Limnochorda pilosa]